MTKHCPSCRCESLAKAEERRRREKDEQALKDREEEFARKHSILTDRDVAWARERLAKR